MGKAVSMPRCVNVVACVIASSTVKYKKQNSSGNAGKIFHLQFRFRGHTRALHSVYILSHVYSWILSVGEGKA